MSEESKTRNYSYGIYKVKDDGKVYELLDGGYDNTNDCIRAIKGNPGEIGINSGDKIAILSLRKSLVANIETRKTVKFKEV